VAVLGRGATDGVEVEIVIGVAVAGSEVEVACASNVIAAVVYIPLRTCPLAGVALPLQPFKASASSNTVQVRKKDFMSL